MTNRIRLGHPDPIHVTFRPAPGAEHLGRDHVLIRDTDALTRDQGVAPIPDAIGDTEAALVPVHLDDVDIQEVAGVTLEAG